MRILLIAISLLLSLPSIAQKYPGDKMYSVPTRQKYEFMRNLPVYADSLLEDLKYPLAWGNSDITDFEEWRKVARQKVFDCMLMPPPPPGDFGVTVIREEKRDGYKARQIEIRLSRYYTVPAIILIPDGKGPFPAINCLHDHGGHLFIGKEKMIRPFEPDPDSRLMTSMEGSSSAITLLRRAMWCLVLMPLCGVREARKKVLFAVSLI